MVRTGLISALLLCAARAGAVDSKAQEEVDSQLAKLALPPPDIEILFEPLSEKRYTLLSGAFELDGDALPFEAKGLGAEAAPLFHGTLTPGPHRVFVKLIYKEAQGEGLFEYADYKLTVQGSVKLIAQKGLRSHLRVTVELHPEAERKQRLAVASHVESEMLAALDDAPVSDVAPRAVPPPPASTAVAAAPSDSPPARSAPSGKRPGLRRAAALSTPTVVAAPKALAVPSPAVAPALPSVPPLVPSPSPEAAAPVAPVLAPEGERAPDDFRRRLGLVLLGIGAAAGLAWFVVRRRR